jgi:hypothetical protein
MEAQMGTLTEAGLARRTSNATKGRLMDNFPRSFRDNLRVSRGALFFAAVIVAALIVGLMAAYSAFDLGSILPKRRPAGTHPLSIVADGSQGPIAHVCSTTVGGAAGTPLHRSVDAVGTC